MKKEAVHLLLQSVDRKECNMPSHVRTGDEVIVTSGSHKGKIGTIERVLADKDMVVIKGVNLKTRNMKPSQANPQGGQVTREAPIHVSNVSPVVDGKPTRVRFETRDDGSKVRVAVRGGKVLGVVSPKRDRAKAKTEQKVSTKLSREARKRQAAG